MNKYCVIVDGCSSGQFLPKYVKESGYRCIHIQSSPVEVACAKKTFNPRDYEKNVVFQGDFQELLSTLSRFPITCIIPGSEPGVELADRLSTALNLFANQPETGKRCRDKFLTGNTLQKQGLRSVKQQKVTKARDALSWAQRHTEWPVVIKPLDSGGGDGFFICHNESELTQAVRSVLGSTTIFNKVNQEVLIQEYLVGQEYVVNTVSYNSQHYVESFMTYKKQKRAGGKLVYESTHLLTPSDCPQADEIFRYTFHALDALGLKYGAAHNELILTSSGPVLLECNARLIGNSFPLELITECVGHTQPQLTVLAYTNPSAFLEYIKKPMEVKNYIIMIDLIAEVTGEIEEITIPKALEELPSFYSLRLSPAVGDILKKTIDLPTSPGTICLMSPDKTQLEKDRIRVRELEAQGFFKIK